MMTESEARVATIVTWLLMIAAGVLAMAVQQPGYSVLTWCALGFWIAVVPNRLRTRPHNVRPVIRRVLRALDRLAYEIWYG